MDVSPFLRDAVYEPEIIEVMAGAYAELLGDLDPADRNDPLAEVIAKEVLWAARLGVRNVAEMHKRVLGTLRKR